ncbi:MAG: hypothetical protein ACXU8R_19140, partial [Xanthobacteraceae bacterium]
IDSAENVARSRLRVNTRKWLLSKTLPKARKGADAIDEGQARVYGDLGRRLSSMQSIHVVGLVCGDPRR